MCACSGHWTYDYKRGCKKVTNPDKACGCEARGGGDVECQCGSDFCNGAGGWTTDNLPSCLPVVLDADGASKPKPGAGAAQLKGEEEEEEGGDSSVGAVMIVDVVVLITGVVASQLLI